MTGHWRRPLTWWQAVPVLAALSGSLHAADPVHWSARCAIDGQAFHVLFDSPSRDLDNADMRVSLVLNDGRKMLLPLSPGVYRARRLVSNQASLCEGIGAYATSDRVYKADRARLLLWLSVDDRPGWDHLTLVLVDLAQAKVLHQVERLAPIKDPDGRQGLTVQVTDDGFWVRLQRQWLQNTGTDSAENSIEDWMQVWIAHGRIRSRWRAQAACALCRVDVSPSTFPA